MLPTSTMPFATKHPYSIAIAASFVSSLTAVFCKGALTSLHPLIVTSVECWVTVVLMSLICKPSTLLTLWNGEQRNSILLLGVLHFICSLLYTNGVAHTTATNALFLTKVLPYWVLFWEFILFRTKVKLSEGFLLVIHIFGAWLLSTHGNVSSVGNTEYGDMLLILAAMASALSTILTQRLVHGIAPKEITLASMFISAVIFTGCLFASGVTIPSYRQVPVAYNYLLLNSTGFALMILLGAMALKVGKAWKVTALRALGPLFGLPFAVFLLNEKVSAVALIGGGTVLITSVLMVLERKKTKV